MDEDIDDPLAVFRGGDAQIRQISRTIAGPIRPAVFRRISKSATSDRMAGDPYHYVAYGQAHRSLPRLEIRRVLGAWHALSYRQLVDIVFNGIFGTEIVLGFSTTIVTIAGKNLQPITAALLEETCTFIQDYHQHEFTRPAPDEPIITSIEVMRK